MADENGKGNGKRQGNGHRKGSSAPAEKQQTNTDDEDGNGDSKSHRFQKGNKWRFPPGQTGNPKGRPKKPSLVDAILRVLERADVADANGIARRDAKGKLLRPPTTDELAWTLLEMCMAGNREAPAMFKELLERLDGKVPMKAEISGLTDDAIVKRQARDEVHSRVARLAEALAAAQSVGDPN